VALLQEANAIPNPLSRQVAGHRVLRVLLAALELLGGTLNSQCLLN
jgi:hypothetical protein